MHQRVIELVIWIRLETYPKWRTQQAYELHQLLLRTVGTNLAICDSADTRCPGVVVQIENKPLASPAIGWRGSQAIPGPLLDQAID